jgi:hypothetical protein
VFAGRPTVESGEATCSEETEDATHGYFEPQEVRQNFDRIATLSLCVLMCPCTLIRQNHNVLGQVTVTLCLWVWVSTLVSFPRIVRMRILCALKISLADLFLP